MIIKDFPMPISVNRAYRSVRTGEHSKMVKTDKYKEYIDLVNGYQLVNFQLLKGFSEMAKVWVDAGNTLSFERIFLFHKKKICRKDGRSKKLDVSNRIKCVDDCICDLLGIDDKYIEYGTELKMITSDENQERVYIGIKPYEEMDLRSTLGYRMLINMQSEESV